MTHGYPAEKALVIEASPDRVWAALTEPNLVREWMHGTNLRTDWEVGGPITWSGEWQGRPYEDKGTVLEFDPQRRLSMTHWSPLSGAEDKPENYHTVTYELRPDGETTELTLTQDNNPTQAEAEKMAAENWGPVLEGLKKVAER